MCILFAAGHDMASSQAAADCSRSNVGVLHLAGEVSQMQSKVSSAASKLLQSADMVRCELLYLRYTNWCVLCCVVLCCGCGLCLKSVLLVSACLLVFTYWKLFSDSFRNRIINCLLGDHRPVCYHRLSRSEVEVRCHWNVISSDKR